MTNSNEKLNRKEKKKKERAERLKELTHRNQHTGGPLRRGNTRHSG